MTIYGISKFKATSSRCNPSDHKFPIIKAQVADSSYAPQFCVDELAVGHSYGAIPSFICWDYNFQVIRHMVPHLDTIADVSLNGSVLQIALATFSSHLVSNHAHSCFPTITFLMTRLEISSYVQDGVGVPVSCFSRITRTEGYTVPSSPQYHSLGTLQSSLP